MVDPRLARISFLALIASVLWCAPVLDAKAEQGSDEPGEEDGESPRAPPAVAVGAGIVPGVLVHGAGSWVGGQRDTGERLLLMEGAGLGLVLAGGIPIGLTGASRYIVGPAAATTIVGFGLFTVSWAADLYAVTAPEGGFGQPRLTTPWIRTEVGHRYVYDPRFSYRHLLVQRIDWRSGSWQVMPTAWWSPQGRNARLRLLGAYRLMGPRADLASRAVDGTAWDLELALTRHDYGEEGFRIGTAELFVRSRTDLSRLASPLGGSFLEMGLGAAVQRLDYEIPGQDVPADHETMLLGRFGFGMYMGGPRAPDGTLLLYYDHRHDGYAAGLLSTLPTSGVLGHFGLDGHMFLTQRWGIAGQAQIGSALVTGLSLIFREDLR